MVCQGRSATSCLGDLRGDPARGLDMNLGDLKEVQAALLSEGREMAEVYAKEGRSRLVRWDPSGISLSLRHEEGWAVRAGGRDASFFHAATGRPRARLEWPGSRTFPTRLPDPAHGEEWVEPVSIASPMVTENEGMALVEGLRQAIAEEVPEAELLWVEVIDGSSRSRLCSSRGVEAE